jgi:sec-independent protein translocase protein TatA
MDFLGIGWEEILLVLVVALLIFGPGKIVEISRTLGKTVSAFKKAANQFSSQITTELDKAEKEASGEKTGKDEHAGRVQ